MFGSREPEEPFAAPPAEGDPEIGATPPKTHDPQREIRLLEGRAGSERDPEGRAFAPLADAYRRAGRLDEALRVVEEGTRRLPEYATGHVVAGLVNRDRGDRDGARSALHRALELDSGNRTALRTLAEIHLEVGEVEEARRCCDRLEEVGSEASGLREEVEGVAPGAGSGDVEAFARDPGGFGEQGDAGDSGEPAAVDDGALLDFTGPDEEPEAAPPPSEGPDPGIEAGSLGGDRPEDHGAGLDLPPLEGEESLEGAESPEGGEALEGLGFPGDDPPEGTDPLEGSEPLESPGPGDAETEADPLEGGATARDREGAPEEPRGGSPLDMVPAEDLLPLDSSEREELAPQDEGGAGGTEGGPELPPPDLGPGPDPSGAETLGSSEPEDETRNRDFLDPEELDAASLGLDPFEAGRGAFGTPTRPGAPSEPASPVEVDPPLEPASPAEVDPPWEPDVSEARGGPPPDEPDPGPGGGDEPVTRTMGDLYAAQGHFERAVSVYEKLVAREPGNFELATRLEELRARAERPSRSAADEGGAAESQGAAGRPGPPEDPGAAAHGEGEGDPFPAGEEGGEPETQAPQWVEGPGREDALGLPSPFAWTEETEEAPPSPGDAGPAEPLRGRSARQYFEDLLAWVPGAVPVEELAPGGPSGRGAGESPPSPSGGAAGEAGPAEPDASEEGPEAGQGDLDEFRSWLGRFGP